MRKNLMFPNPTPQLVRLNGQIKQLKILLTTQSAQDTERTLLEHLSALQRAAERIRRELLGARR